MQCKNCGSRRLTLSRRQGRLSRLLLLLLLCHKVRCQECRKRQIAFLPCYYFFVLTKQVEN